MEMLGWLNGGLTLLNVGLLLFFWPIYTPRFRFIMLGGIFFSASAFFREIVLA